MDVIQIRSLALVVLSLCLSACSSEQPTLESMTGHWQGRVTQQIVNFEELSKTTQEKIQQQNSSGKASAAKLNIEGDKCRYRFNNTGAAEDYQAKYDQDNCDLDLENMRIIPASKIVEVYGHDEYKIIEFDGDSMVLEGRFKKTSGKRAGTTSIYTVKLKRER